MGPHMCGMCKGQSSDPFTCQCPVCICQSCVLRLSAVGEQLPPEIFGRHADNIPLAEEAAKRAADEPRAAREVNLRANQPAVTLQELFLQRKNEIHQSIMRTMDNMNGLEDTFYRALAQEADLRLCQSQLASAQDEIRHLQALPQPQAAPANEALVEALKTQLEQINTRLLDQGALQTQIRDLSTQVSQLKFELQQSVRDQVDEQVRENQRDLQERLQAVARTAVLKVSVVMPLVSHLDEEWLNHEGAESFMELATLGINEDLRSECMRQVARVCSILAKASGPCQYLASFANQINIRIKRNSEAALQFINQLEDLYLLYKEIPTAKASLQRLLRLADSEALDDIVATLLRFGNYLDADHLTLIGDGLMDFIAQNTATRDDWRMAMLGLPVEWSRLYKEEMNGVLQAVVERGFDSASFRLVQLLQVYKPADPTPLLSFVARSAHLLTNPQVVPNVDAYLSDFPRPYALDCTPSVGH